MILQSVVDEFLLAVPAGNEALSAFVQSMVVREPPLHLGPALIFAVDGLELACPHMSLKHFSSEVPATVVAPGPSFGACVQQVVFHE